MISYLFRRSSQLAFAASLAFALILPTMAKAQAPSELPAYVIEEFGEPPAIPTGPLSAELDAAVRVAFIDSMTNFSWDREEEEALALIGTSGDPRLAWIVSDLLRFVAGHNLNLQLTSAASKLLGKNFSDINSWGEVTDHLIAWDIPEPPNYLAAKRAIFTQLEDGWQPLIVEGEIDWRHVSWGGVLIDDRPFDRTDEACNCIPAADNPAVETVAEANWLDDDTVIFGLTINGESRAYPRRIMEVREMVNDTLGGRDLGIPYCTLCGAAQAYFTDRVPDGFERPVLRTSGLLIRSNKVMYDINSQSVFDTFKGTAVTGPLAELGFQLEQAPVITTTWGRWKEAHPETTVLIEDLALGRDFDFRNNRDARGPIFPVGDIDPRLGVHEDVIGIITETGKPIAFQRSAAFLVLSQGGEIAFENVQLQLEAGGIKAVDRRGEDLGSHQAFWFAWSQFHPETELWMP